MTAARRSAAARGTTNRRVELQPKGLQIPGWPTTSSLRSPRQSTLQSLTLSTSDWKTPCAVSLFKLNPTKCQPTDSWLSAQTFVEAPEGGTNLVQMCLAQPQEQPTQRKQPKGKGNQTTPVPERKVYLNHKTKDTQDMANKTNPLPALRGKWQN
ncbi:hypothetical protein PCANC_16137 [Puccinia coronata f. sp. avenae]|uniref:Uncharacterized protein n=1 Tax=Puccinia coronata f. sp. avenae TaxID=200324 RepID=A0A2N5T120_9BASI|nr:hypothetical protein PCANC_16137 [Puccinia coronata f. sp. avenae]